jgi:Domain of unknown function (DUF1707)
MATDDPIRASDADREAVVDTLREAFTAGRLTMDEFDDRMSAAYLGKTWGDLRELTTDLPAQPVLGADIPVRELRPARVVPRQAPLPQQARSTAAEPVPAAEPGEDLDAEEEAPVPARRRPMAMLIPLAVWTLLIVHASAAPEVVFLLIAVFAVVSVMSSIRRR